MINRLAGFIGSLRLSTRAFEKSIAASDGMIRRAINNHTDIQSKWLTIIADIYPYLNMDWLITGKGEMLKQQSSVAEPVVRYKKANCESCIAKERLISELQADKKALQNDKEQLTNIINNLTQKDVSKRNSA